MGKGFSLPSLQHVVAPRLPLCNETHLLFAVSAAVAISRDDRDDTPAAVALTFRFAAFFSLGSAEALIFIPAGGRTRIQWLKNLG